MQNLLETIPKFSEKGFTSPPPCPYDGVWFVYPLDGQPSRLPWSVFTLKLLTNAIKQGQRNHNIIFSNQSHEAFLSRDFSQSYQNLYQTSPDNQ